MRENGSEGNGKRRQISEDNDLNQWVLTSIDLVSVLYHVPPFSRNIDDGIQVPTAERLPPHSPKCGDCLARDTMSVSLARDVFDSASHDSSL